MARIVATLHRCLMQALFFTYSLVDSRTPLYYWWVQQFCIYIFFYIYILWLDYYCLIRKQISLLYICFYYFNLRYTSLQKKSWKSLKLGFVGTTIKPEQFFLTILKWPNKSKPKKINILVRILQLFAWKLIKLRWQFGNFIVLVVRNY